MPLSTFVISNPTLDFIAQVQGQTENSSGSILDVTLSESRSLQAKEWKRLPYQSKCFGNAFNLQLQRPTNAAHLRLDVIHTSPSLEGLQVFTEKLKNKEETKIRDALKHKSITFVGCARQCEESLAISIAKIASLGMLFGSWRLVIFENDSTDGTAGVVQELSNHLPIELIQHPGLQDAMPERTARLAFARNALRERALAIDSDYICISDLDGVINYELPTETSFLNSFGLHECWDAVFPVNAGMYYDIWALRHSVLHPYDYMTLGGVMDASLGRKLAVHFAASYMQIDMRQMSGWLPVDSAFGGMGIYKTTALREARYFGMQEGSEICEHVTLHQQMRAQGLRLFINPNFVVATHG